MKFNCEYCGEFVDSNKHSKCPNCGASYTHNKEFIEQKKKAEDARRNPTKVKDETTAELESLMDELDNSNFSKHNIGFSIAYIVITCVLLVIIALPAVILVAPSSIGSSSDNKYVKPPVPEIMEDKKIEAEPIIANPDPITVGFNELAENDWYSIICDSYKEIEYNKYIAKAGYIYIQFHFVIENKRSERLELEIIGTDKNGVSFDKIYSSEEKTLSKYTPSNSKVEGYKTFEIPEDTDMFIMKFGDYTTIEIENTIPRD